MRKGKTKVYFVPTITTLTAPTVAQITAGTRLDQQLAEVTGFEFANQAIDAPDMGSSFVGKVTGEDQVTNSTMTFYEDDTTNAIRTALPKGTTGYIVFFPAGTAGANPAINDKCETWPVQVASSSRKYSVGNEAAQYVIAFTNTAGPTEGVLA
jgi:hypothetical protein